MRNIVVDVERNRIRLVIKHDEDESVFRLKPEEAAELSEKLNELLSDFEVRKSIRID